MKLDSNNKVYFEAYIGKCVMTLDQVLKLEKGSVISTTSVAGQNAEIYCNDTLIGTGEIMVFEKNLGVRVKFNG